MKTYLKLILFMFLMIISPLHANAIEKPDVTIKTNTQNIDVGQEFLISVVSTELNDLFSLSFQLKFNTDVIEILSVFPGEVFENEPIQYNSTFKQLNEREYLLNYYSTFLGDTIGKTMTKNSEIVKIKAKLLQEGKTPLAIINENQDLFIGTPNIRLVLIDNDIQKNNFSNSTGYITSSNFKNDEEIKNFILDVYKKTFSRDADKNGFIYWYHKLISREYSTRIFLINLLNEREFIEKDLSNEEFITAMYSIIAAREPDQIGYNYWLNKLLEFNKYMPIIEAKAQIILRICNEAELYERATNMNLDF